MTSKGQIKVKKVAIRNTLKTAKAACSILSERVRQIKCIEHQ